MPSFLTHTFASSSAEGKVRDKVLGHLRDSVNRYGGQNEKFRQLSRYYYSLSPSLRGPNNDQPTSRRKSRYPDLFVSRPFTAIEAAVPPWVFSVVGGNPPVKVYGRKPEQQGKSDAVEKMLAYDWERSEVLHRSIEVAKQMFKYGTGIAKISYKRDSFMRKVSYDVSIPAVNPWRDDGSLRMQNLRVKGEEEIVRFDGPWMDPVSVFNAHPDPYYHRIKDMRYFIIDRWTDRKSLKIEDENHYRLTGKNKFKNLEKIPRMRGNYIESLYNMSHGDDIAEAMGWTSQSPFSLNRYLDGGHSGNKPEDDLIHLVEYWDREDKLVILANDETPILDGPNPFDDNELPFVAARCYVVDGQFWGLGYLYTMRRSVEEMNRHRNLWMRQAELNTLNVWGYDENVGVPGDLSLEPGKLQPIPFYADGKPNLVPLYQSNPLPPEVYQLEDRLDKDIQLVNAQPNYSLGPTGADSATEANIANENIQSRIRLQSLQGELTYATEIARFFHARRQQYLKDEGEVFRILGPDGLQYERFTPQDIAGEYDFVTAGQHIHATPAVLRQQMQQAIALIGNNPIFLGIHKPYEVWRELWKLMDFPRPEVFLSPPRENTLSPQAENRVLDYGEWVPVNPNDNHEIHVQVHTQGLVQAQTPEAQKIYEDHIGEHRRYLELAQAAQAPPQEQPGMRGYEGNVPNMQNAMPTPGGIMAGIGGGGQGGA